MSAFSETVFLEQLKTQTNVLHGIATHSGFNPELFKGNVTRALYGKYLLHKFHFYTALEEGLRQQQSDDAISKFIFPELERAPYLRKDIVCFMDSEWENAPMLSSVASHVYRLHTLITEKPHLLIAHAYTNYLAELSGGMIIRNILAKQYKFDEPELNAYAFEINDVEAFKTNYRDILCAFVKEYNLQDRFIEEVKLAYIFSISALEELVFLEKSPNNSHNGN